MNIIVTNTEFLCSTKGVCEKLRVDVGKWFAVSVGVPQSCVMSMWLLKCSNTLLLHNRCLQRLPRIYDTLSGRIGKVVASHAKGCRVTTRLRLHRLILCTKHSGVLPMRVWGATSQLDLLPLTPLSVSGCGRLQLGVLCLATSVDYCKQLTIDPTF